VISRTIISQPTAAITALFVLPGGGGGDGVRILVIVGGRYDGSFTLDIAGSEAMRAEFE
jgi:hypothetical protein